MRYLTNTVAVAQKPLVNLSDAVGIYVISVDMPSLMQASEAITTSMTHPFGLQTVARQNTNARSSLNTASPG